jgi:hypothetical protein
MFIVHKVFNAQKFKYYLGREEERWRGKENEREREKRDRE